MKSIFTKYLIILILIMAFQPVCIAQKDTLNYILKDFEQFKNLVINPKNELIINFLKQFYIVEMWNPNTTWNELNFEKDFQENLKELKIYGLINHQSIYQFNPKDFVFDTIRIMIQNKKSIQESVYVYNEFFLPVFIRKGTVGSSKSTSVTEYEHSNGKLKSIFRISDNQATIDPTDIKKERIVYHYSGDRLDSINGALKPVCFYYENERIKLVTVKRSNESDFSDSIYVFYDKDKIEYDIRFFSSLYKKPKIEERNIISISYDNKKNVFNFLSTKLTGYAGGKKPSEGSEKDVKYFLSDNLLDFPIKTVVIIENKLSFGTKTPVSYCSYQFDKIGKNTVEHVMDLRSITGTQYMSINEYDSLGRVIKQKRKSDFIQNEIDIEKNPAVSVYSYGNDGILHFLHKSDSVLVSEEESYEYLNHRLSRVTGFSNSMKFEHIYDHDGKSSVERITDFNGKLIERIENQYDEGNLIKSVSYDNKNKMNWTYLYSYQDNKLIGFAHINDKGEAVYQFSVLKHNGI